MESKCPECGALMEVEADWIGLEAECPSCQQVIVIQAPKITPKQVSRPSPVKQTNLSRRDVTKFVNKAVGPFANFCAVLAVMGCLPAWIVGIVFIYSAINAGCVGNTRKMHDDIKTARNCFFIGGGIAPFVILIFILVSLNS